MKQSVIVTLFFAAKLAAGAVVATSANLRGNEDYSRALRRNHGRNKHGRGHVKRIRQQAFVRTADPWEMEDKDDGNDWDVKEEEIIDIFDWDDGDAAAAFEEEVAEFQAAASALSDVAMSGASEKTEISSSATIASVSTWFLLVTFPIWYLN